MSEFFYPALAVVAAFSVSWAAVPLIAKLAVHRKLLDYPDGNRHHHLRPVPRLGGVAVFVGVVAAVVVIAAMSPDISLASLWAVPLNRALLWSGLILFLIGLFDDLRGVSPLLKLTGQTAAAIMLVTAGFSVEKISIVPGSEVSLGFAAAPIAVLWLVGVSNAFNLIDGLDGLAGGVGVIALAAIAASAMALGSAAVPISALALIGALLGFLRYNWHPARIFLGDSGSLVVGFLLAVLSVKGATSANGVVYVLVPLFALSYLLLDTGIAMMRRWLRGEPLSRADGRHVHHRLLGLGLNPPRAVSIIYAQSLFVALLGLCVTFVPPAMTVAIAAMGGAILVFIMVYGVRWLDYHEFLEAGATLASGLRKARMDTQDRIIAGDLARRLSDATSFEHLNRTVSEHAPAFRFVNMEICRADTAVWDATRTGEGAVWHLDYPIKAQTPSKAHGTPLVLRIWSPINQGIRTPTRAFGRTANAERVASIIVPVIAKTLHDLETRLPSERHSAPVDLRSHKPHRRASGGFRSSQPLG